VDRFLQGRVAVVTGASRGFGRSISVALAAAGATLALIARDEEKVRETAREISEAGGEADWYLADVTDEAQVLAAEKRIASRCGHVDILVNNAGIQFRKAVVECTLQEWNRVIDTNLTSSFLMCRAFLPHMRGRGWGRIVMLSSVLGPHIGLPLRGAYCASKAAVLGLTHSLAQEVADEGIAVIALSPGPFTTGMTAALHQNPEVYRQFLSNIPASRFGAAEEMGKLVTFLCSDGAGFITGTDIVIDGGWSSH